MKLFQAKVKWQNYTRQYAFGVVEAAPKFREFPEKWPIRSRETMSPPYSRTVECNLRYAQKISKENYFIFYPKGHHFLLYWRPFPTGNNFCVFSPKVLGYMKEKRVRNDMVFYTCGQSLGNASGYVIKNVM